MMPAHMSTQRPAKFYTFWSVNDRLDQSRLRKQIDDMKGFGFDGAVFHPRFYPGKPPYMSAEYLAEVSDLILYAKSVGMEFWIYDENGWPSGTADGLMYQRHPDEVCVWVELSKEKSPETIRSFSIGDAIKLLPEGSDGERWHLNVRRVQGIDCMDPQACRDFLGIIHEGYRAGLKPEAFDYVSAFFSDEPELGLGWGKIPSHGNIPWTRNMPRLWKERFGEDLLEKLPLMFFPAEGYREFRIRYREFATDLFCGGFFDPYLQWCQQHGKTFTAHVKGEEHPMFQVIMSGSCSRVFQHISLPGIDALERYPHNHFYPRQLVSVAQQFGSGESMVECFGGSGWGARPEDLERYLDWLGGHGITHYVLHLYHYRLLSSAIHDWPPSQPVHMNWREVFPSLLARFKKNFAEQQREPADTLLVSPHRGIMAEYQPWELAQTNIHMATPHPDSPASRINDRFMDRVEDIHRAGINYHLSDERTLEESGVIEGKSLRLGKCSYGRLIVADGAVFTSAGRQLIESARAAGIPVENTSQVSMPTTVSSETAPPSQAWLSGGLQWSIVTPANNEMMLDSRPDTDGWFVAEFEAADRVDVTISFADAIAEATLNGTPLAMHEEADATAAAVSANLLANRNVIRFRGEIELQQPVLWLRGRFLARSRGDFAPAVNQTIKTDGPFELVSGEVMSPELVAAGLPFCRGPVEMSCEFENTQEGAVLQLSDVAADAARVELDGEDLGFVYGPDWSVTLPKMLQPGRHTLRLRLIPSTYNFFGPHHYFAGDYHVVSPGQYAGTKNFADREDAPQHTLVHAWHFKPVHPPEQIRLIQPAQ